MKKLARGAIGLAAGCALVICTAGCAAEVAADTGPSYPDYDVQYIQGPPVASIEAYPHYYYRGSYAYWVHDRWYQRTPQGWAVYRHEPPELSRYRPYVQAAPPAPRTYGVPPGYGTPPTYGVPPTEYPYPQVPEEQPR
jgi:hypothetical protein